jgi:hypothetical protein
VLGHTIAVEGGRHDRQRSVAPSTPAEECQQEIDVETAFVKLVEYDRVELIETLPSTFGDHSKDDASRGKEYLRISIRLVLVAHAVSHASPELAPFELCHSDSEAPTGDTARLYNEHGAPLATPPWHLGRLP